MKHILLLSFLLMFSSAAIAEEEVYLDLSLPEINRFDTGELRYENKKQEPDDEEEDYLKSSFQTIKKMFDEDFRSENEDQTRKHILKK